MYTGGVSSLAEQIANQLQTQEEPKPLLGKRELVELVRVLGVVGSSPEPCRSMYMASRPRGVTDLS